MAANRQEQGGQQESSPPPPLKNLTQVSPAEGYWEDCISIGDSVSEVEHGAEEDGVEQEQAANASAADPCEADDGSDELIVHEELPCPSLLQATTPVAHGEGKEVYRGDPESEEVVSGGEDEDEDEDEDEEGNKESAKESWLKRVAAGVIHGARKGACAMTGSGSATPRGLLGMADVGSEDKGGSTPKPEIKGGVKKKPEKPRKFGSHDLSVALQGPQFRSSSRR